MPTALNLVTIYASLLDACTSSRNLQNLKRIHAKIITSGISRRDFIRCKLMASYASCAQLQQAHTIFLFTTRKPTFLFNTLIRAYASLSLFSSSLYIFRQMLIRYKKTFDDHTLPVVLKCCAGLTSLQLGRQVHGVIVIAGYALDLADSNGLIDMYSKCGNVCWARKVFDRMLDRNVISWSAMISGYATHGMFSEVFSLFNRMMEHRERPDGITFTSVLMACSHGGFIDKGKIYFEMMEERFGLKPQLEHYTCMVYMFGRVGLVEEAEKLILKMEVEPDEAIQRALLGACKIHGKVDKAKRYERRHSEELE